VLFLGEFRFRQRVAETRTWGERPFGHSVLRLDKRKAGQQVRPAFGINYLFWLTQIRKMMGISKANTVRIAPNQPGKFTDSVSSMGAAAAVRGNKSSKQIA